MRDAFHQEIDEITHTLVEMTNLVKRAMNNATQALIESNLQLAEDVIRQDEVVDNMQHELDARTMLVLAKQQPVASDLRTLVTSLRMSADLERIGDMAHHIAKSARIRFPNCAVPNELTSTITAMGQTANRIITKLAQVMKERDVIKSLEIAIDDDEMDKLHRELIATLLDDKWSYGTEVAIDMTLIGRYYERCADHAVSISRRVYFLVTGEYFSQQQQ